MEIGNFELDIHNSELESIASQMLTEQIISISQVCERYGNEEDEVRYYDVYYIKTPSKQYVLKKTDINETNIYTHYLTCHPFNVPHFYGSITKNDANWICIEYIEGSDLREMTDALAVSAAKSLSEIQLFFWSAKKRESSDNKIENRFLVYWKRILRRAMFVADNPILRDAYQLFLNRQLTCPCTLSNGDFLEWNAINIHNQVVIIDWGFGGIMPYSLDIARFIAHATENRCTFPFYMNEMQRKLFLNTMYENLKSKISYDQFIFDIKLALLNEYIEFAEADEDENKWYITHAIKLANEILTKKQI